MHPNAQLVLDTIRHTPVKGIPSWLINPMEHAVIERLAGVAPGEYIREPVRVYLAMQRAAGTCMIDQWIPENPLSMGDQGYEGKEKGATEGAERVVLDGILIDSPEAVVEHLEQSIFPALQRQAAEFDEETHVRRLLEEERNVQQLLGPEIVKCPYGCIQIPYLRYDLYGYANYFMAYALYPEIMERHFSLQADLTLRVNRAVVRAVEEGGLPRFYRADHDIADSRGTLVDVRSLDRIWFPHFTRCLAPVLKAGIALIWHCDGNLMQMVPRLLDAGFRGFQGFQYEDGMDYARICKMKTRDGNDLVIIGGVSVTRTLPFGTPDDVKTQLRWLVENGPRTGLFLGGSSSIAPGTPYENIRTMVEGFKYYREHGRTWA